MVGPTAWRAPPDGRCSGLLPPETNLGPGNIAQVYSARCAAGRNSEAIRTANIPAHLLNSSAKRRNRIQSDAGVAAAFLVAIYVGCLYCAGQNRGDEWTGTRVASADFAGMTGSSEVIRRTYQLENLQLAERMVDCQFCQLSPTSQSVDCANSTGHFPRQRAEKQHPSHCFPNFGGMFSPPSSTFTLCDEVAIKIHADAPARPD